MEEKKKYLVVWTYMANYGNTIMEGYSKQDVLERHLFYNRKDIALYVALLDDVLIKEATE